MARPTLDDLKQQRDGTSSPLTNKDRNPDPCGWCGKTGHATEDCREPPCPVCGSRRHTEDDCKACKICGDEDCCRIMYP